MRDAVWTAEDYMQRCGLDRGEAQTAVLRDEFVRRIGRRAESTPWVVPEDDRGDLQLDISGWKAVSAQRDALGDVFALEPVWMVAATYTPRELGCGGHPRADDLATVARLDVMERKMWLRFEGTIG